MVLWKKREQNQFNITQSKRRELFMKDRTVLKNRKGSILVIVLLISLLISLLAVGMINLAITDLQISRNMLFEKKLLLAAESGIEKTKAELITKFIENNSTKLSAGEKPDWDFILNGSESTLESAESNDSEGGVKYRISELLFENFYYSITIWNNDGIGESGSFINDCDDKIFIRCDSFIINSSTKSVEILLQFKMIDTPGPDYKVSFIVKSWREI